MIQRRRLPHFTDEDGGHRGQVAKWLSIYLLANAIGNCYRLIVVRLGKLLRLANA